MTTALKAAKPPKGCGALGEGGGHPNQRAAPLRKSTSPLQLGLNCFNDRFNGAVHNYGLWGIGGGQSRVLPVALTMSTMSAVVTMMMAAMAQVLRAQRVLSIQVEKATSFLGKTCREKNGGGLHPGGTQQGGQRSVLTG